MSDPEPRLSIGTRRLLANGAEFPIFLVTFWNQEKMALRYLLRYGSKYPSRSRREPVNDIPALVKLWVDVFAGCCTAHSKAEYDSADYKHDEMLQPILAAPVAQLREFGSALCTALESDDRIPYIVWRPFVEILQTAMKDMTKERALVLKERLARDIAEAVEEGVKPQVVDAITNALKWRSEETLTKVKTAVETGAQPKLVGRQSCLFLEVAGERVML